MAAPWVVADAMVESEIGETLSPNVAPDRSAPTRKAGSTPSAAPAG